MNPIRHVAHRLRPLFFRRRLEAEMAEEMSQHLERLTAQYVADGLSLPEALDAAKRRFGNLTALQESGRDAFGWRWLELFMKDVRLALRHLARAPGFALLAIVTLGLGIGANTAMFNALDTVMLRPLPYPDAARLDRIYRATPQDREGSFAPADFLELRRAADGYGEVAAYATANVSLSEPGHPAELASAARVTANLFSVLGVKPELGRDLVTGEEVPGKDRVVILSRRTWLRRFDGSFGVIGRTIRVDGEPHQIVGVLPETFNDWRHLGRVDVFRPLALAPAAQTSGSANLDIVGRRSAACTRTEADGLLARLGARRAAESPEINAGTSWRAVPLRDTVVGADATVSFGMLIGLSGFVLLIACSNLANLLLARTMARARELAVRSALGASRTQLLRPLIAESLLLSLAGGVCALVVAYWAGQWLTVRSTGDNGEVVRLTIGWAVFGWALAASFVTAVAFGTAPALFAVRLNLNATLKSGGRGATGGRGHQRFHQALIVGQFALAMVLLAGAGLFIRGLNDLNNRRAGWESARLVTTTYVLPDAGYEGPDELTDFHRRALERLESLPGVASASISAFTPFFGGGEPRKLVVEGRPRPEAGREPVALVNAVTPRYFETFGTTLLAGRAFLESDSSTAPRVYVVNETMARTLFGGEDPVGRRLVPPGAETSGEIVGVARDVRSVRPDKAPITFQVYVPMAQEPRRQNELAVRSAGVAPAALVESVRTVMTGLDPDLPLRKLQPADATILRSNYTLGVFRDMLTSFAVLGLALASLGIYGVIARLMAQRSSEFAIRLALGATVSDLTRLVLASGVRQALAGAALGLLGAFGVSRLLAAANPGMRTDSPEVLVAAALLLVGVALLACWMPARRAGQIDATLALRSE